MQRRDKRVKGLQDHWYLVVIMWAFPSFVVADELPDFSATNDSLTPRYAPGNIQSNARQGKFLKTTFATKPVSMAVSEVCQKNAYGSLTEVSVASHSD